MKAEKMQANLEKTAADVVGSFLDYVEKNDKRLALVFPDLRKRLEQYRIREIKRRITASIKAAHLENVNPVTLYVDIKRLKGLKREDGTKRER